MACSKAVADKVVKSGHILDAFFIEEITRFSYGLEVQHKKKKDIRDSKEKTAGCLPFPPSSLITKSHWRWQFVKVNQRRMRRGEWRKRRNHIFHLLIQMEVVKNLQD